MMNKALDTMNIEQKTLEQRVQDLESEVLKQKSEVKRLKKAMLALESRFIRLSSRTSTLESKECFATDQVSTSIKNHERNQFKRLLELEMELYKLVPESLVSEAKKCSDFRKMTKVLIKAMFMEEITPSTIMSNLDQRKLGLLRDFVQEAWKTVDGTCTVTAINATITKYLANKKQYEQEKVSGLLQIRNERKRQIREEKRQEELGRQESSKRRRTR